MRRLLLLSVLGLFFQPMFSQTLELDRTFIINGGCFSDPDDFVTAGFFEDGIYTLFDEIQTASVQDAVVSDDALFVTAQDSLVRYNLMTLTRDEAIALNGLNQLAIYDDYLLLTRQYPVTTESFMVLDAVTLEVLATIELSGQAGGIAINDNQAYVAVPGAWGSTNGTLAIIDLQTLLLDHEIDLGSDAKGTKEVFIEGSTLYTVNSHFSDYNNNIFSITEMNLATEEFTTTIISGDYYGYYGNSVMTEDALIIPLSATLCRYDLTTGATDLNFMELNPAAIAYEPLAQNLHITTSNYVDWGNYDIYDVNGYHLEGPVAVGTSPEAMVFEYVIVDAVYEIEIPEVQIFVKNNQTVVVNGEAAGIQLYDLNGRLVFDYPYPVNGHWNHRFSELHGIYIIRTYVANGVKNQKIMLR